MANSISESQFGEDPSAGNQSGYVAQLGRISGKALQPNLIRNGVDLTFRNGATDLDLLYLDVNNKRVGIKTDAPNYDLEIISDVRTTKLIADEARIDNILISNSRFSTVVGPINIVPVGPDPKITIERLITDDLEFNENNIRSFDNSNIVLDASGTGTVELESNTNIRADLYITGNIDLDGDLSTIGSITIGNESTDIIIVETDFTQTIKPGEDLEFDLGTQLNRWNSIFIQDLSNVGIILPQSVIINNKTRLDGQSASILGLELNNDTVLSSSAGAVYIEQTKWQDNDITNMLDTPLVFANTGIGYLRFDGNNGVQLPFGPTSDRRLTPEVGETRWNTDFQYLECFDGNVWLISIGPGELIAVQDMEDISNVWSLILG